MDRTGPDRTGPDRTGPYTYPRTRARGTRTREPETDTGFDARFLLERIHVCIAISLCEYKKGCAYMHPFRKMENHMIATRDGKVLVPGAVDGGDCYKRRCYNFERVEVK